MSKYEKLKQIIAETNDLINTGVASYDNSFKAWHTKAELFVNHTFGSDSLEYKKFMAISYYEDDRPGVSGAVLDANHVLECEIGLDLAGCMLESFLEYIPENDPDSKEKSLRLCECSFKKVFIVHGHDGELKESVARVIEKQGIEAIILSEKANQGRTIIEKFEDYSNVGGAICLFTADDIGNVKTASKYNPRARQNVVFEAGYFMGKLGRDHTVILTDPGIEMPSDLSGVVYTNTGTWQFEMLRELKAMGYTIDFNKLS